MNSKTMIWVMLFLMKGLVVEAQSMDLTEPIMDVSNYFEERSGLVAVEAEYFYQQSLTGKRKWYRTSQHNAHDVTSEEDSNHSLNASGKAYIEILPDTRVTHEDKLIVGENFSNEAGKMAIIHYKVKINNPGRYYVWLRAFSTGSEDNGVHVGLNGKWPDHGQRMQWCEGKNVWTWASRQRTKEEHCGIPGAIYLDIEESGFHDIQFSMREDGFEFDKFVLTQDPNYVPKELGPGVKIKWTQPSYYQIISTSVIESKTLPIDDFPIEGTGYYKDAGGRWLAINPNERKEAHATTSFNFKSSNYDVVFVAVGENDGRSDFTILINDEELGHFSPALTHKMFEEGKGSNGLWQNVPLKKGDQITVRSKIGSTDGREWARARWAGLIFTPVGKGEEVKNTTIDHTAYSDKAGSPYIHPPTGRIAIVADGNSPDPDDLGATAVSLALLRATGLEDRLVHYSHSCDLVRVERISEDAERERHALMQSACDVTARRWGGFEGLTFYDAKWQQNETVNDLKNAINNSTIDDPLWIIEAGEPDIIGYALDASDKSKHQFVKVITHHPANDDAGDFYTWQQILDFGIEEVRIPDQNVNLKVKIENWDWAKNHIDPRIQWIWLQGKIAEVDNVVKFQKGKWDCSDAGMLLYWITGATQGGLRTGTVNDIKKLLLNHIDKIKALIIDGQNNHVVWPKSTIMMKQYLEETGLFEVEVQRTRYTWKADDEQEYLLLAKTVDTKNLNEPKKDDRFKPNFKDYDVIISNFGWKAAPWPEDTQKSFEEYIKSGGGFVSVHAADNSFPDWDAYNQMIGLGGWGGRDETSGPYIYYDDEGKEIVDPSKGEAGAHGRRHSFPVTIRNGSHPITKGMPKTWLTGIDECYAKLRGPAQNLTILATGRDESETAPTDRHEPILMVINYGSGRIFHTTLGHDTESFENVGFITSFQRGSEWAARGKVSQMIPIDFPTDSLAKSRTFKLKER